MDFISYPRLQDYLDSLDEAEPVLGNITFGVDGVFIDNVTDPGQKESE